MWNEKDLRKKPKKGCDRRNKIKKIHNLSYSAHIICYILYIAFFTAF